MVTLKERKLTTHKKRKRSWEGGNKDKKRTRILMGTFEKEGGKGS